MKFFVVHAHPEPQSFSASLKSAAVEELLRQGHDVRVSDLYGMQFNPVASKEDFGSPADANYCTYALEQRNGIKTGTIAPDIRDEVEKLLWCDVLILNFPMFWFSTPAILKGWIDRVLVSGTVYGGKRFYERGGLRGKRSLVSVTLGGQEHMFGERGIHGPLDSMLKHLLQGTLAYVGLGVLKPFVGWHIPYVSNDERELVMNAWRTRLQALEGESELLEFPNMSEYDDRLHPLPDAVPA